MSTPTFPSPNATNHPWGWRGFAWNVEKTPVFNTTVQHTVTGRRAAVSNYANPLWHFKCQFAVLRDRMDADRNSTKSGRYVEYQALVGFLMQRRGQFEPFFFKDPTDNYVTGQIIYNAAPGGATDFQMVRNFGYGATIFTEPVGGIDVSATIVVRVNGTPTTAYTANTPYDGWIRFTSAPGAGEEISADFGYVFKVVCTKDGTSFRTFAKDYWECTDFEMDSVRP